MTEQNTNSQNMKIFGILDLIGIIISPQPIGNIILLGLFYLFKKDDFSQTEKEIFFSTMNFHLSFFIYIIISALLIFILIGFLLLPIVLIAWIVYIVIGTIAHFKGEDYKYPFVIQFFGNSVSDEKQDNK